MTRLDDRVEVVALANCEDALAHVAKHGAPDLALVDLDLPGMSGLDGISALRGLHPDLPVVVVSSSEERDAVFDAVNRGAMGFIPKSSSFQQLNAALQLVLAKGIYLPATVFLGAEAAAAGGPVGSAPPGPRAQAVAAGTTPAELGLTPRQAEVLHLILQGKAAKTIARELNLSPATIKTHTSSVLRALNVTTRTQAIIEAGRLRLRFG